MPTWKDGVLPLHYTHIFKTPSYIFQNAFLFIIYTLYNKFFKKSIFRHCAYFNALRCEPVIVYLLVEFEPLTMGEEPISNHSYETSMLTKIGIGGNSRTRTYDPAVNSRLLSQLSYIPI